MRFILFGERPMAANLEAESTLTDRYQTTVPETVRRALRLGKRDKIHYRIRADGEVVISRAPEEIEEDPVIGRFLEFVARDLSDHPERLRQLDTSFVRRVQNLVDGVDVDFDQPLSADDE
jgi:antitoxin PrlF